MPFEVARAAAFLNLRKLTPELLRRRHQERLSFLKSDSEHDRRARELVNRAAEVLSSFLEGYVAGVAKASA